MNVPARGVLAGALATVLTVVPSLAQQSKSAFSTTPPPVANATTKYEDPADFAKRVGEISEKYPGVVVGVFKGDLDTKYTSQQIGDRFRDLFKAQGVPAKYVATPIAGHTVAFFAVDGYVYQIHDLMTMLKIIPVAVEDYNKKVSQGIFPAADLAEAKPEPKN